jgi:hypothetical protein
VFDGLLPEPHNSTILQLLFTCAHWHGLAKLRLHTDHTLKILDDITIHIGVQFRAFTDKTCPAFDTCELAREKRARERRQREKLKESSSASDSAPGPSDSETQPTARQSVRGPRAKKFNIQTPKFHALGDYATTIRTYGTTDSYSTEPVSLTSAYHILMLTLNLK